MLGWLSRLRVERQPKKVVEASYESASTVTDLEVHFGRTDTLSPNASIGHDVRLKVALKARHEAKNDPYARGIVTTMANDTIGRQPRLQMEGGADPRQIEHDWNAWMVETHFPDKLRTMRSAKCTDGDTFGRLTSNPNLELVNLDFRLYEMEQVQSPTFGSSFSENEDKHVDGVELDGRGNPLRYFVFAQHPGGNSNVGSMQAEGEWVPAEQIVHLFRRDRPGQQRGMSEMQPALHLFPMRRRYSLATLAAAETAADFAGVIETTSGSYDGPTKDEVELGTMFPTRRRMLTALPFGWKLSQLKAEQPVMHYKDYHDSIIREIARCLNVPFNVAAGDSSEHNYASGRLDHQTYFRSIDIERSEIEAYCLEKVFTSWLREYLGVTSGIRQDDIELTSYKHQWHWDPHPHADPEKAAKADEILWNLGLFTDSDYLGRQGKDPEQHYEALAMQNAKRQPLNMPMPGIHKQEIDSGDGRIQRESQS